MKLNITMIVGLVALALAGLGYWNKGGIAVWIIMGGIAVTGAAWLLNFHLGKTGNKMHAGILAVGTAGLLLFAPAGIINSLPNELPGASLPPGGILPGQTGEYTAMLKVPLYDAISGTYQGAELWYFLDPSSFKVTGNDRYEFMKTVTNGNLGTLRIPGGSAQADSVSVSSGSVSRTYVTGRVNQVVKFCGYLDITPAAAENASVCKDIVLDGVTSGSTPEWQWHFSDGGNSYKVYDYPSFRGYDEGDVARTIRFANRSSSLVDDKFTFYVYPGSNGQKILDAYLFVETTTTDIASLKKVKIINEQTQASAEYTSFANTANMDQSSRVFVAAPALTTSTKTMYAIGPYPGQTIRYGTQDKGKYRVEVTFDHAAAAAGQFWLFKATENTNALTSTGGNFKWAANMNLSALSDGTNASSWLT